MSIIVSMLVNAMTSAVQSAAERKASAVYGRIRERVTKRYGPAVAARFAMLERNPLSREAQVALARALSRSKAARDSELLKLVQVLGPLLQNPMSEAVGADLDEVLQRGRGTDDLDEIMQRHVGLVIKTRGKYKVDDTNLLTPNLSEAGAVPSRTRKELAGLHDRVRGVVERIALLIENGKYEDAEQALRTIPMAVAEREKAERLIAVDKRMHISFQTLRTTVEFFSDLNERMLDRLEREQQPDRQLTMMLGNAIVVYELADFAIDYVHKFVAEGGPELEAVQQEVRTSMNEIRARNEALDEQARSGRIEEAVRAQTLQTIAQRRAVIDEVEREWRAYTGDVRKLSTIVDEVRAKVPTLELIRDNAGVQLHLVQLIALMRFLKQNTDAIRGTLIVLQSLRLAPLTVNRVRRLIGSP
ncbi:hypothetical protein [Paractinoplanes lichenicola]|uniref:Uncharacterized protein n=1 Tax=Paractinoplanes lichenicola TaxID=2802976 RepID=A0ABS1VVN7_9ACTN|nr:hypothetical protein [Actinoplanes lichenicola]MBL7258493.1 hypothetical protein [Actinoplanes lichenicola]